MKKILVLGGKPMGSVDIVEYAHNCGWYVIVTDYLSVENSPAKQIADEVWDISTYDVDLLEQKCKQTQVDKIFTGIHEGNIMKAIELSNRLGLDFYTDMDTWNRAMDKSLIKQYCLKSGLPIIKEYDENKLEDVEYPVIVKPIGSSAGRGITVATNEKELIDSIKLAKENSGCNLSVIEKFLTKDHCHHEYIINDAGVFFTGICDRIMHQYNGANTELPIGYKFPSKYQDMYFKKYDRKVKNLIKDLGIKDGIISFQSFIDEDGLFIYDPSFRIDGSQSYHMTEQLTGYNYIKSMLGFGEKITNDLMYDESKCGYEFTIYLTKGRINKINGIEEISAMSEVIYFSQIKYVGDYMPEEISFTQMFARVHLVLNETDDIKAYIKNIFNILEVLDEDGESLIINEYRDPIINASI